MVKVTVLTSGYNGEPFLQESIESILSQSFTDFEFIIVDDGSTDKTPKILDSYHDPRIVRLYNKRNQGLIFSLNKGLEKVEGQFIARHDADDISLSHRLERQVRFLDANPNVVIVGAATYIFDEKGQVLRIEEYAATDTWIRWNLLFHNPLGHPNVMFRSDIIRQHRLRYGRKALHAEDYALWSNLLRFGEGRSLVVPLVKYRFHHSQVSNTCSAIQESSAVRISKANLKGLGFDFSDEEVKAFRRWFFEFPSNLGEKGMRLYGQYLQILHTFSQQPNISRYEIHRLRKRIIYRMLKAVSLNHTNKLKQISMLQKTGLLKSMLREDAAALLFVLLKLLGYHIREKVKGYRQFQKLE